MRLKLERSERGHRVPFFIPSIRMHNSDLVTLIEKGLSELEFTDTYLIDTKVNSNKIEIFLDCDTGIDFLKCQKLSRWLEAIFDENKVFGESYTLEVSSPGVGSPLKLLRQYPKNIGRIIDIKYGDGLNVKGLLKDVQDNTIYVEHEVKFKEGKKNKKKW